MRRRYEKEVEFLRLVVKERCDGKVEEKREGKEIRRQNRRKRTRKPE
jgi:hypothetical protein